MADKSMKSWTTVVALGVAPLLVSVAGGAAAHSFKTAFIAPMSGAQADIGRDALAGFMFATAERDAHPDQESDGHLGGLDVYVLVVDAAADTDLLLTSIAALVERERVEIVAGVLTAELEAVVRDRIGETGAVAVFAAPATDATTMRGEPFAEVFQSRVGRAPSRHAMRGYAVARIIDRLVRRLGGDFSDRTAVIEALRAARPQ